MVLDAWLFGLLLVALASPLLSDPRGAVRQGAAWVLAPAARSLDVPQQLAFEAAAAEFVASERYNADQPENLLVLGVFYGELRQLDSAVAMFKAALRLAPRYAEAYVDLARVLRVQGREAEVERTLRDGLAQMVGPNDFAGSSV